VTRDFGQGVSMYGAEGELQQVLSNILVNAVDASRRDSAIVLRTRAAGPWCWITVLDQGCGIAPASRRRIFEPFYTTKDDVGTGLGLWITKELVEKNQGTISLRSSCESSRSYTVFRIRFPRQAREGITAAPSAA
jgi:signal transduction histidine kinase